MVAIPLAAFAVPQGATIDQVRLEDFGGAIGFFVDDISFQAAATTPVGGGLTQDQADARYAPLVHAARHSAGAADPVTVTALAGFPAARRRSCAPMGRLRRRAAAARRRRTRRA